MTRWSVITSLLITGVYLLVAPICGKMENNLNSIGGLNPGETNYIMNKKTATLAALLTTVVLWGLSFIAIKIVLQSFSPLIYMFLRFSLATLIMFSILLWQGIPKLDRATHFKLFLTGLFEPGLYYYFETLGLTLTTATKASIILATLPIWVTILARIFLHERISKRNLFAIFMSAAGISVLILGQGDLTGLKKVFIGDLLIFGAALCAAIYMILARDLGSKLSSLVITSYQFLYGSLLFLPLFIYQYPSHSWSAVTFDSTLAFLFLVLFCSVAGYFLYNYALTQIPASRAAVFLNGVPLVTAVAAALILHEYLTSLQITGALMVIAAVLIANFPTGGRTRERAVV